MKVDVSIDAMISRIRNHKINGFSGRVGCVYPNEEKSYYVHSNIEGKCEHIECLDGTFYAEVQE